MSNDKMREAIKAVEKLANIAIRCGIQSEEAVDLTRVVQAALFCEGALVSIDVSTGDADADYRVFGRIIDKQPDENEELVLLAEYEFDNFNMRNPQPSAQVPEEWRLTIGEAINLATVLDDGGDGCEGEPVATVLSPDPYDERDGVRFSLADWEKLNSLPAGTKLYVGSKP